MDPMGTNAVFKTNGSPICGTKVPGRSWPERNQTSVDVAMCSKGYLMSPKNIGMFRYNYIYIYTHYIIIYILCVSLYIYIYIHYIYTLYIYIIYIYIYTLYIYIMYIHYIYIYTLMHHFLIHFVWYVLHLVGEKDQQFHVCCSRNHLAACFF